MKKASSKKRAEPTVEVMLDLGRDLKARATAAARRAGMNLNDFIVDAAQAAVRRRKDYNQNEAERFTPHGGKHKSGKHSGYEETDDGKFYPAPMWVSRFDELFAERTAIYNLVGAIQRHAEERLIEVEQAIGQAKADLIDDIGLDPNKDWVYYGGAQNYLTELQSGTEKE